MCCKVVSSTLYIIMQHNMKQSDMMQYKEIWVLSIIHYSGCQPGSRRKINLKGHKKIWQEGKGKKKKKQLFYTKFNLYRSNVALIFLAFQVSNSIFNKTCRQWFISRYCEEPKRLETTYCILTFLAFRKLFEEFCAWTPQQHSVSNSSFLFLLSLVMTIALHALTADHYEHIKL